MTRRRARAFVRRSLAFGPCLAAVALGACAGDSATPGGPSTAAVEITPATTGTAPAPPSASDPSGTPLDVAPSSVHAATPSVGASLADEVHAATTCDMLRTAGFESRKAALVAYVTADSDDALLALRQQCAADVDRLDAALAIEARRDAALAVDPPLDVTDLACDEHGFSALVTNRTNEPLGALLAFRYVLVPSEKLVATADEAVVIWALAPGESVPISGAATYTPMIQVGCRVSGEIFLADESPADAALGEPADHATTGDDPTSWLPALLDTEMAALGSGDVDAASSIEDIRSAAYRSVVDDAMSDFSDERTITIRVCPGTIRQPSPDRMTLVFFQEWTEGRVDRGDGVRIVPAGSRLHVGVFRRGGDGRWRWLGTAQPYASSSRWETCGEPTD